MTESPPSNDSTDADDRPDEAWRVHLPDHVGLRIERRLPETNFDSVEEYVTFALESLLRELDADDTAVDGPENRENDPDDPDAVRDRLESLGYL